MKIYEFLKNVMLILLSISTLSMHYRLSEIESGVKSDTSVEEISPIATIEAQPLLVASVIQDGLSFSLDKRINDVCIPTRDSVTVEPIVKSSKIEVNKKPQNHVKKKVTYSEKVVAYIDTWGNVAKDMEKEHGYSALTILAVGGLESDFGTSFAAKHRNNFHGLYEGKRVYSTPEEGFRDFARFLDRYKRYSALKQVKSHQEFANLLHTCGFNPFHFYPKRVLATIEVLKQHGYSE
jgi:flagellum-specific peptidoglycan hydrolase FlgJ